MPSGKAKKLKMNVGDSIACTRIDNGRPVNVTCYQDHNSTSQLVDNLSLDTRVGQETVFAKLRPQLPNPMLLTYRTCPFTSAANYQADRKPVNNAARMVDVPEQTVLLKLPRDVIYAMSTSTRVSVFPHFTMP